MAIKMIDDWKKAWKFASVQFSAVGLVLMGILELVNQAIISLPPSITKDIPNAPTIGLVLFGLGIVGRLLVFTGKKLDGDQQP